MTGDMDDEGLTCQLYATIPLGSLTGAQEIVNGTVTCAPFAGLSDAGAGGELAVAELTVKPNTVSRHSRTRIGRLMVDRLRSLCRCINPSPFI
jgi:hypothetical protein